VETLPRRGYRFVTPVLGRPSGAQPGLAEGLPCCYLAWTGREAALREGPNVIGRAEDAAVRIDADTVSRHHARIHVQGKKALLEDLGSKNGTFLGGRLVEGTEPMTSGTEIRFGSFPVVFRLASRSPPTFSSWRPASFETSIR
jgi:predicted component of type VI protein secretion system